jgi:ATP-binding cassette subfamily B protein
MFRYDLKFNIVGAVLYQFMVISLLLFMIYLKKNNQVSTGDFLFVMLTAITLSFDFWEFTAGLSRFMKTLGDFKSSFSVVLTPQDSIDIPNAKNILVEHSDIRFENLSFTYDEHKHVFHNLNLSIPAGQKIGLVGHSGAGKSTLISLLLKNFKPSGGAIYVSGHNIAEVSSDPLRAQISLIPQDILLFHRSIAENIGYAKEQVSRDEIIAAAKMANIHDFIQSLPNGYDTEVGERGVKLSGGQRQRIAIARAILKDAPIVILDEATSSLDTETEQHIQASLRHIFAKKNVTVIAIAHRLSTLHDMDRIVVLDQGRIVEDGSIDDLLQMPNGHFKQLWDRQVNGMIR